MSRMSIGRRFRGFTLAELLIALAILGVIATFTIPKVLQAQQNQQKKAEAKEVAASIASAYQDFKRQNPSFNPLLFSPNAFLAQYFNYVSQDTASLVDDPWTPTNSFNCATLPNNACYRLHNGGMLFSSWSNFNGSASTNVVWFAFDPDGKYSNAAGDPNDPVVFWLYYPGRVTSGGSQTASDNICNSDGCGTGYVADPSWFSWN